MSVSEERAEKALRYLAETDQEFARLESYYNGLDRLRHPTRAAVFEQAAGNNAEREARAYNSREYRELIQKIDQAERDYLEMKYKRETEKLIWEHWRSVNANRRYGSA